MLKEVVMIIVKQIEILLRFNKEVKDIIIKNKLKKLRKNRILEFKEDEGWVGFDF